MSSAVRFSSSCTPKLGALLYQPELSSLDSAAAAIAIGSAIAIFRFKIPTLKVVGAAAAVGVAYQFLLA